ncbi:MAG: hypothetical protein JEY71_17780 [Sphaerochaeta sp.]|nr:hypothetical protein [Sphaerochaeta sp.]
MKKILASLLTILLLTIAFVSCNLDGTSGIFREIALSKAPLSIRYKQLLGDDGTYLYFRTEKGIARVDKTTTNTGTKTYVQDSMASSEIDKIIQAAAFSQTDSSVFYITNNTTERDNNTINLINTGSKAKSTTTASTLFITSVNLKINNLYANGMIMVEEKDGTGKLFELLKYNGTTAFDSSVTQFTLPATGYGLQSVIQQTGHGQDSLSTAYSSMLVSFVKISEASVVEYEHHLVTNLGSLKIATNTIKVANFLHANTLGTDNIYVLSTDGKLYFAGTYSAPLASWVELNDSGKIFDINAFAYTVENVTDYHFISKPSVKSSNLEVFTFAKTATTSTEVVRASIQLGYAKELSLTDIVSALEKSTSPSKLLVATDENGMFDITINPATANIDNDTNGSSSTAEDYSF